ncbi:unnamed protein product [Trichogramma brassicae]|uniref:Major facilitator superfamily (MFS) profile domain-containing protein n=1 Tax=Trichogramma brassicae TaxID=86971 RepID=A0A6H5I451_9HYME|nr:unnamed protein product [Trichogramma brassicae]
MGYTSGIQTESYKPTESQTEWLGIRHLQVFYLFWSVAFMYGMRVCMSVAIVAMSDKSSANPHFHVSTVNFRILSSFFWGYAITQVPGAYLANFMHSPHSFCTVLVHALAVNYGWKSVVALRFFTGLGQGVVFPCVQMLLSKWAPPGERARLGSVVLNSTQFGSVVTMALSGLLSKSVLGWPSIFYFFGACGLVWSLCYFYLGDDSPAVSPRISAAEREYIETSLGGPVYDAHPKIPWRRIFTSMPVWSLIIVHGGNNWGYYLLLTGLPTYMKNILGFDVQNSGMISALPYLVAWLLGFPISWLCDWALRRGFCSTELARKLANSVGMMSPALGMTCLSLLQTQNRYVLVSVLVLSIGLTAATTCGFLINYMDLTPQFAGAIMSVSNIRSTLCVTSKLNDARVVFRCRKTRISGHLVFYLTAGIYAASNLFFVIFGKATIQPWNHINVPSQQTVSRK